MKKITLIIVVLINAFTATFAQTTCPTVNGYGFTTMATTGTDCSSKVFTYISNPTPSPKSIKIQVYLGIGTGGTLLVDNCFALPGNAMSNYFETESFTANCMSPITYVISSYNSANGNCNSGAACGASVTIIAISAGPLPIKMSAFYAKRKNATVALNWQTQSEINAKEFILQRKVEKDYVDVAVIPATNKANGSVYGFTDNNNFQAVSQYRLKMVDQDGEFKYSEVRTVKGMSSSNEFTVFPNPSSGDARVTVSDITEPTDVQLIDISGRVLKTIPMNNNPSIDITDMQKGMYLIRITKKNSGEQLTKKITVLN